MADFYSHAFGLTLASDAAIPGLIPDAGGVPDVRVHTGGLPAWVDVGDRTAPEVWSAGGDPDHEADAVAVRSVGNGDYLLLTYGDGMRFLVSRAGSDIWVSGPRGSTPETAATYLLGPVFGLLLRLRGVTCLHASVVVTEAGAVAVVGPSGAGKSTVAAACALRGHRVLSDDIAVLVPREAGWAVEPAVPTVRLWDDSVELLFGAPAALPLMAPGWDKRQLDLTAVPDRFAPSGRVALAAVYVLDDAAVAAIGVGSQRMSPRDALLALIPNTYASVLLDRDMRAAEFRALSQFVSVVPVWRVPAPSGRDELHAFCERLEHTAP